MRAITSSPAPAMRTTSPSRSTIWSLPPGITTPSGGLLHLLRLRPGLFQVADVEEGLFGEVVAFAFADVVEALEGLGDLGVGALLARELLGNEERLAEEPLDLAGAGDDQLVFFGEFVHAEDGDDVLEVAVALEHLLDAAGDAEVFFAD